MPQQGVTPRADLKLAPASQHRPHIAIATTAVLRQVRCRHLRSARRAHRRGGEAVPVLRPLASRNVVVPFESVVAVPVVRPDPSRNVLVPLLSVVTVPMVLPLESRMVVCCADAAVIMASVSAAARVLIILLLQG